MSDLYTVLDAVILDESNEPEDNRPQPSTVYTASVETINNDRSGTLLQAVTI